MLPFAKLAVMSALLLLAPLATAQNNLGALLDAGAKQLSPEEFKQEVVQRTIVGPTPAGLMLELIYTVNGIVEGTGIAPAEPSTSNTRTRVSGEWKLDQSSRICTSMKFTTWKADSYQLGSGMGYLPPRCQFWFKLSDKYFLSDSDSDRSAKVLSRTLKP